MVDEPELDPDDLPFPGPGWTKYAPMPENQVFPVWVVLWDAGEDDLAFGPFVTKAQARAFMERHPTEQRVRIIGVVQPPAGF